MSTCADSAAGRPQGERLYAQVAYMITDQRVHDREFGNLLGIKDNFTKKLSPWTR